jgi:hypothetical protein
MTATVEQMQTPDFCCPCGGFLGWKQIRLGGRKLSRSYGDLRLLGRSPTRGWAWNTNSGRPILEESHQEPKEPAKPRVSLEDLPVEVLGMYVRFMVVESGLTLLSSTNHLLLDH